MVKSELGVRVVRALAIGAVLVSCQSDDTEGTAGAPALRRLSLEGEEASEVPAALPPPEPLRVPSRFVPPVPAELAEGAGIIQSYPFALALGKAFFWDEQAGSDGQACASCHFHAGADPRLTGQLNPGFLDVSVAGGDVEFGSLRSDTGSVARGQLPGGGEAGPGVTLTAADFPLHRLQDETDADSPLLSETNDAVSSAGVYAAEFLGISEDGEELCGPPDASVFHLTVAGSRLATRQVEPRNTPSTINAVFNMRQFWDGRANHRFNGLGVFGERELQADPDLRLIVLDDAGGLALGGLALDGASLASQAVGPISSPVEMSCAGRRFADVGRKLSRLAPLARQRVDASDSVLGALAAEQGPGLKPGYTYPELIRQAFAPRYWAASGSYRIEGGQLVEDPAGYTQMEANWSLFWGLSILLYEATLLSDQSEFDALVASGDISFPNCNTSANVDPLLARGCKIFFRGNFGAPPADGVRGAGCAFCHAGTDTFSEGAVQAGAQFRPLLQVPDINGAISTRDLGFSNVGLRPVQYDLGLGAGDPFGNPLAFGRQYRRFIDSGELSLVKDPLLLRAIEQNTLVGFGAANPTAKLESDGATKIPGIRNVALTPPYFSYGGYASLRQVMKFYNRGGNRRSITAENAALEAHGSRCLSGDDSGTGTDGDHAFPVDAEDCNTNITGLITPLGLRDCDPNGVVECDVANDDLSAVVRFMRSLTDRRVQCDEAPFDHPELSLQHGYDPEPGVRPGTAAERRFTLPAVGATGYEPGSGLCIPNAGDLFAPGMQSRVGGVASAGP